MCHFHDPASCFRAGLPNFLVNFIAAAAHMWLVTPFLYLVLGIGTDIGRICTQMLRYFLRIGAINHHCIERRFQQLDVVGVGAA